MPPVARLLPDVASLHQNGWEFDARFGCAAQQFPRFPTGLPQRGSLNITIQNGIISQESVPRCGQVRSGLQTSGGHDKRGRTRVAGATGTAAAGASRPGRRYLGSTVRARLRPYPGSTPQEAQACPARSHLPYRGPAHARHHRVRILAVRRRNRAETPPYDGHLDMRARSRLAVREPQRKHAQLVPVILRGPRTQIGFTRNIDRARTPQDEGHRTLTIGYSGWMPACRMTSPQRRVSSSISLRMSSGVPPTGIRLSSAKRFFISSDLIASFMA